MSAAYEDGSPFDVLNKPLSKFYEGWTRTPWVIVLHYSAGYNAEDCYKTLGKRGLSVHCTIERDGVIWKHLDDTNRAIHAGYGQWGGKSNMNNHALGFEIANLGWMDGPFTGSGSGFLGTEVNVANDGKVYFRRESYTGSDGKRKAVTLRTETACSQFPDHRPDWAEKYWSLYPQEQLEAVFWIVWKWSQKFRIMPENIIGHEHVSPHRKTDPGPAFPWTDLKEFLEGRYMKHMPEMLDPSFNRSLRVKAVQSHLSRLGLPVGDIDGAWGRNTQTAAREALELYGDTYGISGTTVSAENCYELACALRNIPGFDPGRY